jgi:pimeloyl-ACP methyl ester carboxylesterase
MLPIQYALSRDTRVCLYDRAGMGQSDPQATPLTTPPTAADAVTDLHALLAAAGVPGPYVLVGHSAGGAFVQLYARTHPEEVAGVVALNAVIALAYYLRAAAVLYAGTPGLAVADLRPPKLPVSWPVAATIGVAAVIAIALGFAPQLLFDALT